MPISSDSFIVLTARNEADRLGATLHALKGAFPGTAIWVGDDGSSDDTAETAVAAGATVVRSERSIGKGGAATLAARRALEGLRPAGGASAGGVSAGGVNAGDAITGDAIAVFCDGDLGASAGRLVDLLGPLERGEADLAVAAFSRRLGGGVGLAVGFARWAILRRCGLRLRAPISGQRALRMQVLEQVLPFAAGFGMEVGMTIDAARAGYRVCEVEIDLEHRATGRTPAGFIHRGRQSLSFLRVYMERR